MRIIGVLNSDEASTRLLSQASQPQTANLLYLPNLTLAWQSPASHYTGHVGLPPHQEKLTVLFDGDILNRADLRRQLETTDRISVPDPSDAALFGNLFHTHGPAAVRLINGFFSAAIWSRTDRQLHLFLDRTGGFQTLFFSARGRKVVFSDRLPALLSVLDTVPSIDPASLHELMVTGYILPPYTMLDTVSKVAPGHNVTFDDRGRITTTVADSLVPDRPSSVALDVDGLDEILRAAIRRATAGDPLCAHLLSGGIDSSLLVALRANQPSSPLRTFTGAFPDSRFDESPSARLVAEHFGCDARFIDLGRPDLLNDLPAIVWHLDEPMCDFSAIPTYHLLKHVREESPVVVSGDGPDHLFGRYYGLAAKRVLAPLTPLLGIAARLLRSDLTAQLYRCNRLSMLEAYRLIFTDPAWGRQNSAFIEQCFGSVVRGRTHPIPPLTALHANSSRSYQRLFAQVALFDCQIDGAFGVFTKVGKMARAHGLTVREPYLDREFADCILSQPVRTRAAAGPLGHLRSRAQSKYLLKHGLAMRYLPEEIISKKKGGFTPPLTDWLRDSVASLPPRDLLCHSVLDSGWFDLTSVGRILQEHRTRQRDWTPIIFLILSIDLWTRILLEEKCFNGPSGDFFDYYPLSLQRNRPDYRLSQSPRHSHLASAERDMPPQSPTTSTTSFSGELSP